MADNKKTVQVQLPTPRDPQGSPIYDVNGYLGKAFARIAVVQDDGTEVEVVGKNAVRVGSDIANYICAVVQGVLGGKGDKTEGMALFVQENHKHEAVEKLRSLDIVAESSGRGGTYFGVLGDWIDSTVRRATMFRASIEKYPRSKTVRASSSGPVAEEVDVVLI